MADDSHNLTERDDKLWSKRFDSKKAFSRDFQSKETKVKDTVPQNKETLDRKTDDDVASQNSQSSLKNYNSRTTTGKIRLSSKWAFLLHKHSDRVLEILKNRLEEDVVLELENNTAIFLCTKTQLIKSLLENDVTIINHDPSEQSWLKANVQKWKNGINVSQSRYFCIIFSEEDFSKTYICTRAENLESVQSLISEFLDECLTDVRISPEVWEFVMHNETFSDLKFQEKAQDGIRIQDINRTRLAELKKEIKKVTFQSYLVNENEYEILCEDNNEILSDVEKKFHVKGKPYQLSMAGDIPQLLQVNPLVSISCITTSDPEKIPLDSFIVIDSQTPKPETDYIAILQEEKYKIFQYDCWNPPRHQINLSVPELEKKAYSWNLIFEECFKIVFNNDNFPHTIGITIPTELAEHLPEFCQSISSAVTKLPNNDDKPTYILLLVKTSEMMNDVLNILKRPSAETPKSKVSSRSSESDSRHSDISTEGCSVEVIKGSITDMKVDCVVATADSRLIMGAGKVSSELSFNAGEELQRECSRNYPDGISFPEIALCKGYHLPCHFIFFGDIPAYDRKENKNIAIFVEACLQRATVLKFQSIAFTALGTGSLGYEPNIAAEQMFSAIAQFKATTPQSTLKEIIIVIHPTATKMDDFLKLRRLSTSVKDSKAVPPPKTEALPQTKEEQAPKLKHQQLQWIPFVNYSTRRETLDKAIMEFEKELNYVTFPMSQEEAEDLFFFFDLISLVPDIVEQLCLKQETLVVPRKSSEQFKSHLNDLRNHCHKSVQNIPSNVNQEHIIYFLIKINQQYPRVKCKICNNERDVLFKTFEFEKFEEAKHQFAYYVGLRKNISAFKDRFTIKQESSDINETNNLVSSTLESEKAEGDGDKISHRSSQFGAEGPSRNEGITRSTQNIQNICCFPIGDSLLVKVYEADILKLDVDGIVNAANKWLAHGGGVARAIIVAAGDLVNVEGQTKRNKRELNDGEVLSTSAGNLTRYNNIIHAVGPMNTSSNINCQKKLEETICNSLAEANRLDLRSVALPAISSGIFGVPLDTCTEAYVMGVKEFYKTMPPNCKLKEVHFVDRNSNTCKAIKDKFAKYLDEVTDFPVNNIHHSNDNSADISSHEDYDRSPMSSKADKDNSAKKSKYFTDDTSHNNHQSNDNSANIASDKHDAMSPMSSKADKDNSAKQSKYVTDDTSHNNHQSNDNSANIASDKHDAIDDLNAKSCVMCKCKTPEAQQLKCDHRLCSNCKKTLSQPMCTSCKIPFEMFYGDQPNGSMVVTEISDTLPGFPDTATYEIVYSMEDNKWKAPRKAFLPKNENGNTILKMLQLAFRQRLIFTFHESSTQKQFITWGDIHHKTSKYRGTSKYNPGYPDPDYFNRVTKELADKGITPDLVAKKKIEYNIVLSSYKSE